MFRQLSTVFIHEPSVQPIADEVNSELEGLAFHSLYLVASTSEPKD